MYPRLSPRMVYYLLLGPAELRRMCLSFGVHQYAQSPISNVYAAHRFATICCTALHLALSCIPQFH